MEESPGSVLEPDPRACGSSPNAVCCLGRVNSGLKGILRDMSESKKVFINMVTAFIKLTRSEI